MREIIWYVCMHLVATSLHISYVFVYDLLGYVMCLHVHMCVCVCAMCLCKLMCACVLIMVEAIK